MKALLFREWVLLASIWWRGCCTAYDLRDPEADHTSEAIRLDGMGMAEASRLSFEAAAQFTPSTSSFVNLGVCYMRAASRSSDREFKVSNYKSAKAAMERGLGVVASQSDRRLYEENWNALMTNFEIESISDDEDVVVDTRQCGPPADPRQELTVASTRFHRKFLEHQRDVPIADPIPRISVHDIDNSSQFRKFAERREAFILTGATETWKALLVEDGREWLEAVAERWPGAVSDFYPYNMLSKTRQSPYLTRLPRAVRELFTLNEPRTESVFGYDARALRGRYLHLQLTPRMWRDLEMDGSISSNRHWHLKNDGWMDECLSDEGLREEYHLKTHWKIILAGARGAGMFNHSDSLQTSSWHAHLFGQKWWYVCSPFSGRCFESVLEPGEILYYGKGWSHETQNLVTPTITITDTALHERNFDAVADKLHAECTRDLLNFKFSARLCDALDLCYDTMRRIFVKGEGKPSTVWPPWRTVAGDAVVKKRQNTKVSDNNYDGRNYITE